MYFWRGKDSIVTPLALWVTPHLLDGIVNLLPLDSARLAGRCTMPGSSRLGGGGKACEVLPGGESLPHLLTVFGGREEVAPWAEVVPDRTID
jgi:hypothetical protein